jgi:8-oxo-dGTP diphosphatase
MEPEKQQLPAIEVTAGVIKRGQEILIAQRGEGQHLEGFWEFPGGKQENGETLEDCLQREILEELSINISVGSHIMTTPHQYDKKSINLHAFHGYYLDGELTLKDHSDIKWVSIGELVDFEFAPADKPIIKHLMDHV